MRRLIPIFTVLLLACQVFTPLADSGRHTRPAAKERPKLQIAASANDAYSYPPPFRSSFLGRERPSSLIPTETPTDTSLDVSAFTVRLHPDGPLYVGDQVSLEVIAPQGIDLEESEVRIRVTDPSIGELGSASFNPFGIGGRYQATLAWAWDTQGLEPGTYTLNFEVEPGVAAWMEDVYLLPTSRQPAPEPQAHWESAEIDCCVIHYITGTPAARDLTALLEVADVQSDSASARLGSEFQEHFQITILPRVLGHGGFASRDIHVSYLDRNYAGSNFSQVLHHEMVHILDSRLGGELRPSLFVEGMAVYLSRGHYQREPLLARAAVLLDLGWYLSLEPLADDFYNSQHEVGYMQAGALIQYMVRTWGWDAFSNFYRDIHPHESGKQSRAIDSALQAHFSLTFEQLDSRFVNELYRQHLNPDMYDDVRLTVSYYETVRRYQQTLDPSAYFLTAWLPDGRDMRDRELVADYLRRPSTPVNIALEALILEAWDQIHVGDFAQAERTLSAVNQALDRYTQAD